MKRSVKTNTPSINKVILIDDEQVHFDAFKKMLLEMDMELIYVSNGEEALLQFARYNFALALIDIDMPVMDGYTLAEVLCNNESTCAIPFILMLPPGEKKVQVFNGHEKGTFTFISKPFEPEALKDKVKFFIEKFRHEEELNTTKRILKKHIKDLQMAYDELKSFSYTVSHDLRAPLRVISGYSNILIEDYATEMNEEALKVVKTIVRNTKKMSILIDELLNFARLARQDKHLQEVDMTDKFKSIFEELTEHILNRKITLQIKPLKPAYADKSLVRRLITNLLGNAIKYTAPRKEACIEVGGEWRKEGYVYYVKDNGVGFDDSYKNKIFGVFQRLHKENEFEGTGIGLAIVHKVIEHHGGTIWADGVPGKGASFYFTLEKQRVKAKEEAVFLPLTGL